MASNRPKQYKVDYLRNVDSTVPRTTTLSRDRGRRPLENNSNDPEMTNVNSQSKISRLLPSSMDVVFADTGDIDLRDHACLEISDDRSTHHEVIILSTLQII